MKDEGWKSKREGRRQEAGAGGRELSVVSGSALVLTVRRRMLLTASCPCLLPPLSVVALAVEEAELVFAQGRVGDLDLHFAQGAVGRAVRGRVGDEVLGAKLVLNLGEGGG